MNIKELGKALYSFINPSDGVSGRAWKTQWGSLVLLTHVAEGGTAAYFFLNGRPVEGIVAAGVLGAHLLWRSRSGRGDS